MSDWRHISELKPTLGMKIIGWCVHKADPYYDESDRHRLTLYAAHTEGLSHCEDGAQILEWGGAFDDSHWEDFHQAAHMPDWWFVVGSEFEVTANPVKWMPYPDAPDLSDVKIYPDEEQFYPEKVSYEEEF